MKRVIQRRVMARWKSGEGKKEDDGERKVQEGDKDEEKDEAKRGEV